MGTAEGSGRRQIAVVTGASSGIGRAAALELAGRGMTVVPLGRDPARLASTEAALRAAGSNAPGVLADFASLDGVSSAARSLNAAYPHIDVLLLNAGAMYPVRETTADGIEKTFAVNHVGTFLLAALLRGCLAANARVIVTSSAAHWRARRFDFDEAVNPGRYGMMTAYGRSKLANILFTRELARRLTETPALVNCFHPGLVASRFAEKPGAIGFGWRLIKPFIRSSRHGARTAIHLATAPAAALGTGGYFADERRVATSALARSDDLSRDLWIRSAELCGIVG